MAADGTKTIRDKIKFDTRTVAVCAMLVAAALVLSLVERWIPVMSGVPGIRLGLANIATVFAIYALGPAPAVVVVVLRCLLGAVFSGTFSAFVFSICGGLLAFLTMWVLSGSRHVSPIGVCVGGAGAHSIGQILAAMLVLGSKAPIAYLPVLMLVSVVTGLATGIISALVLRSLSGKHVPGHESEEIAEAEKVPEDSGQEHRDIEFERMLSIELSDVEQPEEDGTANEAKDESELIFRGETFEEIMERLKNAKNKEKEAKAERTGAGEEEIYAGGDNEKEEKADDI